MSESSYPETPRPAVGAVVFKDDRVLLVKRKQEPNAGTWAIPGGRVKLGESLQQAAEREILEETGIFVRAGDPVFTFDHIETDDRGRVRYHYVIVDLTAEFLEGEPNPGDDALAASWISADELGDLNVSPRTVELLRDMYDFG